VCPGFAGNVDPRQIFPATQQAECSPGSSSSS
jgi:hypothetical protein